MAAPALLLLLLLLLLSGLSAPASAAGHVKEWTVADVQNFLAETVEFPREALEAVAAANVDGRAALALSKQDWRELGAPGLKSVRATSAFKVLAQAPQAIPSPELEPPDAEGAAEEAEQQLAPFPQGGRVVAGWPGDASGLNTAWEVPCIHDELDFSHRRLLLSSKHRLQPLQPNQRERNFGRCWSPRCFRGVFDHFISDSEADAILRRFRPELERDRLKDLSTPDGTKAQREHWQREGYIGYEGSWWSKQDEPTVFDVLRRMALLLEQKFGARDAVPASINLRSVDFTDRPAGEQDGSTGGNSLDVEYERAFEQGQLLHATESAWHWDNAREQDWLYTCLLFIGEGVEGGYTLIADDVSYQDGAIASGLLIAPARTRLVCFSSGPENVHSGSANRAGYRALFQVWFKCTDSAHHIWHRSKHIDVHCYKSSRFYICMYGAGTPAGTRDEQESNPTMTRRHKQIRKRQFAAARQLIEQQVAEKRLLPMERQAFIKMLQAAVVSDEQ